MVKWILVDTYHSNELGTLLWFESTHDLGVLAVGYWF